MNEKHSAICHLTFYETAAVSIDTGIGRPTAKLTVESDGIILPAVGASLSEVRSASGSFVDIELSAKISDTSASMENLLLKCSYRYGVLVLHYTDGSKKLLGSLRSPILLTYEKSGIPAAFVLSVKGSQPEYAKFIP